MTVKEVKAKALPELDDEFAENAAGFDTLAELREDIASKLAEARGRARRGRVPRGRARRRGRQRAGRRPRAAGRRPRQGAVGPDDPLDVPPGDLEGDVPPDLRRRPRRTSSPRRGPTPSRRCAARPSSPPSSRPRASTPSDGDVLDALGASAARESTTPEKLRDKLEKNGRLDELKDDLAQRQAVDLLAEHAKPISVEQAKARDGIWTPDKDEREAEGSKAGGRAKLVDAAGVLAQSARTPATSIGSSAAPKLPMSVAPRD